MSYRAQRPEEDERIEFLTSTEQWFRPVNLTTGPDGALWAARTPYLLRFEETALDAPLLYRFDPLEGTSRAPDPMVKRLIRWATRGRDCRQLSAKTDPTVSRTPADALASTGPGTAGTG